MLALRYLAEKTPFGPGKSWNGDVATLEAVLGVKRTEAMAQAAGSHRPGRRRRHANALGHLLDPHVKVWIPFALIGVVAAVAPLDLRPHGQKVERHERVTAGRMGGVASECG